MIDIDKICDRFEAEWLRNKNARIENFLVNGDSSGSSALIRELLVVEWDLRTEAGENISCDEYCRRFPHLESYVRAAFSDENHKALTQAKFYTARQSNWSEMQCVNVAGNFGQIELRAEGGLGEVYQARDNQLDRNVAIKRIKTGLIGHPESTRRFKLEAEITGRLEHPGIVPVHAIGTDANGDPFYVMKLIDGVTLSDLIKDYFEDNERNRFHYRSLEFRKLLRYFIDTCETIAYAHSQNVLHRDIKPSNIMLGKYGEVMVVDWGLARVAVQNSDDESIDQPSSAEADDSGKTALGKAVGTPIFMSPEQARGQHELVDERSDVYGLGATLFVILTGKKPFSGDVETVIEKVSIGSFPAPRTIHKQVPRPLEAICLKAMNLQPQARYGHVSELATDIEAYLGDQPVSAWDEPVVDSAMRFLRQRLHWVLSAMLIVALTAAILVANAYRGEQTARKMLDSALNNETKSRKFAEESADSVSRLSEMFASLKLDGSPSGLLGRDYKDPDLVAAATQISQSFTSDEIVKARLLDAIGEHFTMSGQLKNGEQFLLPAYDIRRKYPDDKEDLASSLHHIAFLRWIQGHHNEANEAAAKAVRLRTEALGDKHPKTLASHALYLMVLFESAKIRDEKAYQKTTDSYINCWQYILDSDSEHLDAADTGLIHTIIGSTHSYQASNAELSFLARGMRTSNALVHFGKAKNAFEKSSGFHPGELVFRVLEARMPGLLSGITSEEYHRRYEDAMGEIIELSKRTFHANEAHPGNLVVQLYLIERMKANPFVEKTMRRLQKIAQPVFDNQPRVGMFDMQLAEKLFHLGRNSDDLVEREKYYAEAEGLLQTAIDGWHESIGRPCWEIGEAKKRLGRIARNRGELELAKKFFSESVANYDADSIRGHDFLDYQARGELAEILAMQGDEPEATRLLAERERIRNEFLERLPDTIDELFEVLPHHRK